MDSWLANANMITEYTNTWNFGLLFLESVQVEYTNTVILQIFGLFEYCLAQHSYSQDLFPVSSFDGLFGLDIFFLFKLDELQLHACNLG